MDTFTRVSAESQHVMQIPNHLFFIIKIGEYWIMAYGYLTVTDLENVLVRDLESGFSQYTDTVVESWITFCERLTNTLLGESFSGTIPDHVIAVTLLISKNYARNQLIDDGWLKGKEKVPLIDDEVETVLKLNKRDAFTAKGYIR